MSENGTSDSKNEAEGIDFQQPSWDILADHQGIKIDEKFILKLQKGSNNVNKKVKYSCKVLHFSSEWNFKDVFATICKLDLRKYPQLFIFVIETTESSFDQQDIASEPPKKKTKSYHDLNSLMERLKCPRPIILQLSSINQKMTKIFYKPQTEMPFIDIELCSRSVEEIEDFSTFLCAFLSGSFTNFENEAISSLPEHQSRSIILSFLRTLNLPDNFFVSLILYMATGGTKTEFIAALDAPFGTEGRILSSEAQKNIADVFQNKDDPKNGDSVLFKAINHINKEVIDYLITYSSHLIQLLPIEHKIRISTDAFDTNQLDILFDLIFIADFPFPNNFKVDSVKHLGLKKIEAERKGFKDAIKAEDFEKINEFIKNNLNLKFIYSPSNKSALTEAIESKKFGVFYYLKSLGFKGEKCEEIIEKLSNKERKRAIKQATEQREKNIIQSKDIAPKSVMKLLMRSSIHNSRTDKEQQAQYRANIMKWFTAIHKVAPELIDVAATCEHLKIIFDFESDSIENVSLTKSNADGYIDLDCKWIFIGAKLSDNYGNVAKQPAKQKIKGALAHELSHFVMGLVYENQECPYYKHREDMKKKFEAIVKIVNRWKQKKLKGPDDECNGTISSVFKQYEPNEFHPELIVRVVEILAVFDDKKKLISHLQKKYKILFEFWRDHVIPELQRYLLKNKEIIKLNRLTRLLQTIMDLKIEVNPAKEIGDQLESNLIIVSTNHPKLLFSDICKNLKEKLGILMDSKTIFMESRKLNNPQILDEFKKICADNQELSIVIDCTEGVPESVRNIVIKKELKFIFVVSNEKQCEELKRIFRKIREINAKEMEVNYNWNDLTKESQNLLLKTKINFQNNPQISLSDLIQNEKEVAQDLTQTIDGQLLMFLVENQKISINEKVEDNFELIYQSRQFVKKLSAENRENEGIIIHQNNFLSEVKNQFYVLVSDQAGNGKSWAMKSIELTTMQQNPTNWVTYVDLKQFIEVFKAQKSEPEFSSFMVEHILKPQQQFKAKIFQKMYKDGKVFILFDGFDEIAPNYAKFVSKLAQNFQQNGGNQLWIATRDFFEVDLKKKLKLDIAYSLDEMTEEEGVDLIARSWMLVDLRKEKQELASKQEFNEYIEKSKKYKNYQQKARKIIKKALIWNNNPVGRPQLFKMIADAFKDEENVDDLQGIKIYDKFIDILYKRWSQQKGEIRNQANTEVQKKDSSFFKFLWYHAISSLYPELAKILFPNYDGSEWPNEEIIACGILTIIDGKVYFIHETFREYLAADAIAKALKKPKVDEKIVEVFVEILTVRKFGVIQVFLNDMIGDSSVVIKIQNQVQKHINKFNEMSSFADFFTSNLTNLVDLVLNVLKTGSYKKVKRILKNCAKNIAADTEDSKMFLKFQEFFFDYLKVNDLKDLIINGEVFQGMIKSSLDIEIFEDFVAKTKAKTSPEFVKQGLMLMGDHSWKRNIFYFLAESSNLNAQKVQKFLEIMKNFYTVTEIFELMTKCNSDNQNILQACVKEEKKENLKILWPETEKYFAEQNLPQSFKKIVKQQDNDQRNILHAVALCDKIEVHETLWELLLKLIEDREELKDFILQKKYNDDNCVHELVRFNENPAIIELTFKFLKKNFSDAQFQEILTSKFIWEMNLLQSAAKWSQNVEVHQFLWKFFRDFCGTDEKFLEMLKEVDDMGQNILQNAAWLSSSEIFEFMIQELEKIASQDEVRKMLRNLDKCKRNFMQSAADWNDSSELHKTLWKSLRKYFVKSEILQFINHVDKNGRNLFFIAVWTNSKEIVELTWNEIKSFLTHDEQVEHLKMIGEDGKNLLQCALFNDWRNNSKEIQNWVKNLMQEYEIELQDQIIDS